MQLLSLAIGIVIGLLLNPAKEKVQKITKFIDDKIKEHIQNESDTIKAQFLEPVTEKERYDNAKNVSDLLK